MSRAERIVRGIKAAVGAVGLDDVIEDLAVFGGKKAAPKARVTAKPQPRPAAAKPKPAPSNLKVSRKARVEPAAPSLDMGTEARMARAREMGFDVDNPLYVSTLGDVAAFDPYGRFRGHKGISGISLTDNPELASRYLDRYGEIDYKGEPFSKQMMKVLIRPGEVEGFDAPMPSQYILGAPLPEDYAWPSALENVDTAIFPDAVPRKGAIRHLEPGTQNAIEGLEYILRDPTRVRSFTAAFDPQYSDSSDLMKARGGLAVKKKRKKK